MKGLILCAGKGTRLYPLTLSYPKALLPIANIPVLYYSIEKLAEVDIREIGVIINKSQKNEIIESVGSGERFGVRLTYIYQNEPLGIADAVRQAKRFVGNSRFLLLLGDNLITGSLADLKFCIEQQSVNACLVLAAVANPQDYGIAEVNGENIVGLKEKPLLPKSNLAVNGAYAFDSTIFQAIDAISPSLRGEYEITDAIQWLIDNGRKVSYKFIVEPMIDMGVLSRWLQANRCVLEQQNKVGVGVGPGLFPNSQIIPPVAIGQGCKIKDSMIGPYVSIGANSVLEGCHISNSILLTGVHLKNISHPLRNLVFGPHSVIAGLHSKGW